MIALFNIMNKFNLSFYLYLKTWVVFMKNESLRGVRGKYLIFH